MKVRAGIVNNLETKVGFICPSTGKNNLIESKNYFSSGVAKRIWLIGIDHHHFFRVETTRNSVKGRKFQRTQAELIDQVGKLKVVFPLVKISLTFHPSVQTRILSIELVLYELRVYLFHPTI